jgi:hypothetical protein
MAAVWGLIGVIAGGLITSGWAFVSIVRTELGDLVVAARMIHADLRRCAKASELNRELWQQHREALARALGKRQWEAVASAYETETTHESADPVIEKARDGLKRAAAGRRHVIVQRFTNVR